MLNNKTKQGLFNVLVAIMVALFIVNAFVWAQFREDRDPPANEWLKMTSSQRHYNLRTTASESDGRKF